MQNENALSEWVSLQMYINTEKPFINEVPVFIYFLLFLIHLMLR